MKIGGKQISNWWLIGGVAGIGIVYYIRRQSPAGGAAAGTAATVTDPSTGQSYPASGIDPVTGMSYASEISQYGSVSAAETAVGYGGAAGTAYASGYVGTAGYPTASSYVGNPGQSTNTVTFTSNAAWTQAAQDYLVNTVGLASSQVSTALGTYVTGGAVNAAQQGIIEQAIAAEGYPPNSGPGGFPPGIRTAPSTTPAPAPAPHAVEQYPAPSGLKVTSKTATTVSIEWHNTSPPAASSSVRAFQTNGQQVYYATVALPDAKGGLGSTTVNGLHPGWSYIIQVWQNGGAKAPPGATVHVTLPK